MWLLYPKINIAVVAFLIAIGACSCSREPGVYVSKKTKSIEQMSDGDVIFRANGTAVTKHDFIVMQRLQGKLYRLQKGIDLSAPSERADYFVIAMEQHIPEMLIKSTLMRQEAKRLNLVSTEAEVEAFSKKMLENLRTSSLGIDGTAEKIGGEEGKLFKKMVSEWAIEDRLLRSALTNDFTVVTEAEVTNLLKNVKQFNANANKMNNLARRKLMKAKREILSGEKFADVAKKYSELRPEEGKAWITVTLEELVAEGEAGLKAWLTTAKVGDISDPIDFDDGVAIVGLVAKGEGEYPPNAPIGLAPPILHTLVRCTLLARQNVETVTPAEARVKMRDWHKENAQKELGARLLKEAVLEFPNGTNFFTRVTGGPK